MTDNIFTKSQFAMMSRLALATVSATFLSLVTLGSASAMLPTPEPELDAPTNSQNAAVVQQATTMQTADPQAVQSNAAVATKLMAFLVAMDDNGQQALVPVTASTQLQKGNVIEYQGHFTNTSTDRQRKMTVTMSIPKEVSLIGSISPEFPLASVDGQIFAPVPLRGRIGGQLQEVPMEYYRALRWDIEGLGLGETAVVKYQAVVR
ncbi:hypothetical protein [Psychrobacter sp. I-STPA10]|uniref:hypothetical protein n=1 Tax=Psychrobacter sp. I-STPA10 TaxID=2585769 RepID=UPI001E552B02|nr:hypothetical protein [Psychrobacter sp. I-STPA10]